MSAAMRILLAVDESESCHRIVQYVGFLLGRTPDVLVTLFHVLKPLPRMLSEHVGSENPAAEKQLSDEQEAWVRKERESKCHVLKEACETLAQSGFDMSHVEVKYGHEDNIAETFSKRRAVDITILSLWGGKGHLELNRSSAAARPIYTARRQRLCDLGGGMR